MAIIQCPECGQQLAGGERVCSNCGFPLQKPNDKTKHRWRCRNCGETTDSLICPHCGKSSVERQAALNEPSTNLGSNDPRIEQAVPKPQGERKRPVIAYIILAVIIIGFFAFQFAVSSIRKKLIENTEYVKELIVGVWETSDGQIYEIYKNGNMVGYAPQQDQSLDVSTYILSEIESLHYNGYTIPDPSSYSLSELKGYYGYLESLKGTGIIGIPIRDNYHGVMPDVYRFCEFIDENSIVLGGSLALTRIQSGEPDISDKVNGAYVAVTGTEFEGSFTVINLSGTNTGIFKRISYAGQFVGVGYYTILDGQIILDDSSDYYEVQGTDLVEVITDGMYETRIRYKKVSDLSYCGQIESIVEIAPQPDEIFGE